MQGIEKLALTEWSEQLADLSGEQIKNGLDKWKEDWPPSAPEFRRCCLNQSDDEDWRHKGAAYKWFDKSKALPHKCSDEVAQSSLAEMKKKLGI